MFKEYLIRCVVVAKERKRNERNRFGTGGQYLKELRATDEEELKLNGMV